MIYVSFLGDGWLGIPFGLCSLKLRWLSYNRYSYSQVSLGHFISDVKYGIVALSHSIVGLSWVHGCLCASLCIYLGGN